MREKSAIQPEYLYKYYSPRLIENIFVDKTIRFTPVRELNDPFEALIGMDDTRNWHIKIKNTLSQINDKMEACENFRELVLGQFGILCLSAIHDDIKMWSHYADSHKGFVLKFKIKSHYFDELRNLGVGLEPIRYTEKRYNLTELKNRIKSEEKANQAEYTNKNILFDLVFNKSIIWKYEREYRMIAPYASCANACKNANIKYNCMGLYPLSTDSIAEVILGAKMSSSNKELIKHFIKYGEACKHIEIKDARLDESSYKIVIDQADI